MNEIKIFPAIFIIGGIMSLIFLVLSVVWEAIYLLFGKSEKGRIILENTETAKVEKDFEVATGVSVLNLLREEGVNYPSSCPGQGICGQCKIMADKKLGDLTAPEKAHINGKEAREENGFIQRLACQCKIDSPGTYRFKVRPSDLHQHIYTARVIGQKYLTFDKVETTFKIYQKFSFQAGQFISIEIPTEFSEWYYWIYGGQIKKSIENTGKPYLDFDPQVPRLASYSIASSPGEDNQIKLIARNVSTSPRDLPDINCLGPSYINNTFSVPGLRVGDEVKIRGPFGHFYLQPKPHEAVAIAGGSGMAPIVSILETWFDREKRPERLVFFLGERRFQDIVPSYLEKWLEWEVKFPNFIFVPVLSGAFSGDKPETFNDGDIKAWEELSFSARDRLVTKGWVDKDGKQWWHHTGFIPPIMKKYLFPNPELNIYECGPGPMILTCNNELIKLCGIKPENTHFDDFFNISTPPTIGISNQLLFKKNEVLKKLPASLVESFLKQIDKIVIFDLIFKGKFSEAENFITVLGNISGDGSKILKELLAGYEGEKKPV